LFYLAEGYFLEICLKVSCGLCSTNEHTTEIIRLITIKITIIKKKSKKITLINMVLK
jgi:hypothetical protein